MPAVTHRTVQQHLLASVPGVLLLVDSRGLIRFASGQLDRLGGRPIDALIGSELGGFLDPEDRPLLDALLDAAARRRAGELIGPIHMPYLHVDGSKRLAKAWAINRLDDPELHGLVVLLVLESAYDHFDQVLAAVMRGGGLGDTLSELAEALRHPPVSCDCFFVVPSADGRSIHRWPHRTGVPGPPLLGPWDERPDPDTPDTPVAHEELAELPEATRAEAAGAGYRSVFCFPVQTPSDGLPPSSLVVWSRQRGPLAPNAKLVIDRALGLASLVAAHASAAEQLGEAKSRDPLTGLGNRGSFLEALVERVAAGERPALLRVDLDGIRQINDELGQLAGDATLRALARRLSSVIRPTDELARIDGGEFAILCGGEVTRAQAIAIAERIVARLAEPVGVVEAAAVEVGASVGIALGFPPGTPPDALLGRADEARDAARAAGRGAWRLAPVG